MNAKSITMPLRHIATLLLLLLSCVSLQVHASPRPILIGLDGEFGLLNSTSAQAIEKGALIAIEEINRSGGLLGGRPLQLVTRDNRSVPARGIVNIREFAAMPDMVAVLGGRFSPVILQEIDSLHEQKLPLLAAWSSANGITGHKHQPSYTFRLSLRDSYAMPVMLNHAKRLGASKVGLLVPNTGWGRSNASAARKYLETTEALNLVDTIWYNWGEKDMLRFYSDLKRKGVDALILVANDIEGSVLVRQLDEAGIDHPMPIISHWGVTGGNFVNEAGPMLQRLDYSVVQTFSLFRAPPNVRDRVMGLARELFGIERIEEVESPVGFGHAYDLVHLLARAVTLAGSTERPAIRDALEKVRDYHGLTGDYPVPFTAERHDAMRLDQVFMARFNRDGVIVPIEGQE